MLLISRGSKVIEQTNIILWIIFNAWMKIQPIANQVFHLVSLSMQHENEEELTLAEVLSHKHTVDIMIVSFHLLQLKFNV